MPPSLIRGRQLLLSATLAGAFACGPGCQTFSLTKEDMEKLSHGEMVDRDVGTFVDFLGVIGLWHGAGWAAAGCWK